MSFETIVMQEKLASFRDFRHSAGVPLCVARWFRILNCIISKREYTCCLAADPLPFLPSDLEL